MKFSSDGSEIAFFSVNTEYGLQVLISDSGKGISEEKLPFIFDRFYQVDDSKTYFTLRLPIEEIMTRPQKGAGTTTFDDRFKRNQISYELTKIDKRNVPNILLVEDNNDMRHFIKEQLTKFYKVKEAINGETGLKKAIADPPRT